ncbi:MAG: hypothetical protein K2H53_01550 [Clostridia bacterium]|nr:hypothetical protein [Clostridia bacterium]
MKKHFKSIIFIFIFTLIIAPYSISASSILQSIDINKLNLNSISQSKIDELKETIENLNIDENVINSNIGSSDLDQSTIDTVIKVYDELSNVISNEEIANFIEDNKKTLSDAGANDALLSASSTLLKTFDADAVIDIVQNDLNINQIIESSNSSSATDIVTSVIENTTTATKIKVIFKLLFSNDYFKLVFALIVVVMIYSIIITGIIFKKAGKPSFGTIIPLYRDIIHLKLCNFSPWILLLVFVPIIRMAGSFSNCRYSEDLNFLKALDTASYLA